MHMLMAIKIMRHMPHLGGEGCKLCIQFAMNLRGKRVRRPQGGKDQLLERQQPAIFGDGR
ncbi:hypothetical protein D3C87_1678940 [compost metagenome]